MREGITKPRVGDYLSIFHVPAIVLLFLMVALPLSLGTGSLVFGASKAAPICLAGLGCFAINNAFDSEQDKINKPYRPIPRGVFSRRKVLRWGTILEICSAVAAVVSSSSVIEIALYWAVSALASVYSPLLKAIASYKWFYTGFVFSLPLALVGLILGFSQEALPLLGTAFFFVCAKEVLMDIWDAEGDRQAGIRTLPVVFGNGPALIVAFLLLVISLVLALYANLPWLSVLVSGSICCFAAYMGTHFKRGLAHRVALYVLWLPLATMLGNACVMLYL